MPLLFLLILAITLDLVGVCCQIVDAAVDVVDFIFADGFIAAVAVAACIAAVATSADVAAFVAVVVAVVVAFCCCCW